MGIKRSILNAMFLKSSSTPDPTSGIKNNPAAIKGHSDGPVRYNIMSNVVDVVAETPGFNFPGFPQALPTVMDTDKVEAEILAFNQDGANSDAPGKRQISDADLHELEELAQSLGTTRLGYCKLDPDFIFQGEAILYTNAIVIAMKMEHDLLLLTPSKKTSVMYMVSYNEASRAVLALANRMREMGYDCQPVPASVGPAVFPPIAARSGIGAVGRHGLMIVPEAGTSVRLSLILTDIENLPLPTEEECHKTITAIQDYCATCGKCLEVCPGEAIYEQPIDNGNGIVTHIDKSKCVVQFAQQQGCGICLKFCPQINGSA